MPSRDDLTDSRGVSSGVIKIEWVAFVLLKKQHIGGKEIGNFESPSVQTTGGRLRSHVTAHRAAHRVAGELLRPANIQEALASHRVSPVGRADQYPLAFKKPRELPREIERNLFSVRVRATLAGGNWS